MEADFQQYYGLDLCGFWRGELSARRAWVLTVGLPAGSRIHKRGGGIGALTEDAAFLWRIEYVLRAVNSKKAKPLPLPEGKKTANKHEELEQRKMHRWVERKLRRGEPI